MTPGLPQPRTDAEVSARRPKRSAWQGCSEVVRFLSSAREQLMGFRRFGSLMLVPIAAPSCSDRSSTHTSPRPATVGPNLCLWCDRTSAPPGRCGPVYVLFIHHYSPVLRRSQACLCEPKDAGKSAGERARAGASRVRSVQTLPISSNHTGVATLVRSRPLLL